MTFIFFVVSTDITNEQPAIDQVYHGIRGTCSVTTEFRLEGNMVESEEIGK